MDKEQYNKKILLQKEERTNKMNVLSEVAKIQVDKSRVTNKDSQYRKFEEAFGANILNELNHFLLSLDKSEFISYKFMNDPLLLLCQKVLDWQIEVGSEILREVINQHGIKNAWEQVKKEQDIIENSRQKYKAMLNNMMEENPNLPSSDPAGWYAICDGFNPSEVLQQFGYPLPFNKVFA